jgi:hypothetical protein
MESGGESGKICISEDTKTLLEFDDGPKNSIFNKYVFNANKMIQVPSVDREINSFFIEPKIFEEKSMSEN